MIMPAIQSDTINPTIRPIMSIKNDFHSFGIISDIICGEFIRNKSIKTENYNKALVEYGSKNYGAIFSEQELNQKIQEALKILYDIKG